MDFWILAAITFVWVSLTFAMYQIWFSNPRDRGVEIVIKFTFALILAPMLFLIRIFIKIAR